MAIANELHRFQVSRIPHVQQFFDFINQSRLDHQVDALIDPSAQRLAVHLQTDHQRIEGVFLKTVFPMQF